MDVKSFSNGAGPGNSAGGLKPRGTQAILDEFRVHQLLGI
jgi:hypothetical protein